MTPVGAHVAGQDVEERLGEELRGAGEPLGG